MSNQGIENLSGAFDTVDTTTDEPSTESAYLTDSLDSAREEALIKGLVQDIKLRKAYANKIFVMMCIWLALILLIVILQGSGGSKFETQKMEYLLVFNLSETTVVTLITTTTLNVLAFFLVVTKYLFPNQDKTKL